MAKTVSFKNYPNHRFRRMLDAAVRFEQNWRKGNQDNLDYYNTKQWTAEQEDTIKERGQQPTTINVIQSTVDMILALEIQKRADIQVIGCEGSDDAQATILTSLLSNVFDRNNYDFYNSMTFKDAMIVGRGWLEANVEWNEQGKQEIVVNHLPWEQIYLDPFSRKPDGSDARYMIRVKWVDKDIACKMFPDFVENITNTFDDEYKGAEYESQMKAGERGVSDFYFDRNNDRIKICECYYSRMVEEEIYFVDELTGKTSKKNVVKKKIYYVIFSDDIILQGSCTDDEANENPLKINHYPFIPVVCDWDEKGHPKGVVANLKDIQDLINKLNSKFVWIVSSNRVLAEEGAFRDLDDATTQLQRPDGVVVLKPGGLQKVKYDQNKNELSYISAHLQFLLQLIQRLSGVNDSMMGMGGTNERSGIMQSTRIAQGAAMQTTILENLYFSKHCMALVVLRLIGMFYTDYRIVRETRPNGESQTFEFNGERVDPKTGASVIFPKISDTIKYDVKLKVVPPFSSIRDRMLSIFSEVCKAGVIPPEVAAQIMLSLADIPNKEQLVAQVENYYKPEAVSQRQQSEAQAKGSAAKPAS